MVSGRWKFTQHAGSFYTKQPLLKQVKYLLAQNLESTDVLIFIAQRLSGNPLILTWDL